MADSFVDAVNNKATGGNAIVPEAMDLLKTFESFKPTSYYDLDNKKKRGTLTVGYGFTKNDIPEIREGYSMDKATAERLLPTLVKTKYGATVREKVKVPLNDQQYSALSSFAYNVGPTNFSSSTLVKKLNAGDYEGAASEFKKWNKAGGKELEGLSRRRAAEAALFKGDTMELGKILEKQKFGNAEPKKKGGVAEAGDSFINAMGQADLMKAVSAPIGEGGSPDNPPAYLTPENAGVMLTSYPPKFESIKPSEVKSEALTPLPDSPEVAGAKAAEEIAKDMETPEGKGKADAERIAREMEPKEPEPAEGSPEAVGKAAAEKIAKDVEAKKDKPASAMEEVAKAFAQPDKKEESAKQEEEKEKDKEALMRGVYFNSPTLGTVVSGLKRGAGLGRMK
jgi:GH24 family phage-related lysozyme (muramidase)